MRRKTFDALMAAGGMMLVVVLLVAGSLLAWGHSFAQDSVRSQLSSQKIFFPPAGSPALQPTGEIGRYLTPYAGRQLTTGTQAEVYADHFIAVHLRELAGGQTYSQVSGRVQALKAQGAAPTDPALVALQGQAAALFQGTTLRGLLLNAYAFGKMGQIAGVAAVVSFVAAALMLLLAGLGFWHLRRVPADAVVLPKLTAPAPRTPRHEGTLSDVR